ncbi:hypothetical protein [Lentzea sp. NPDC060358]|uniref:hypothetical protein n=1 Tax=Lentzea sp. NPDC060358 TaxID=3347103 RepID=UPI003663323E
MDVEVISDRVRVTANATGLSVYRKQGSTWVDPKTVAWNDLVDAEFTVGTFDSVPALWASTKSPKRMHLVDSRLLSDQQWREVKAAVAAWTSGRVDIDLSRRDDPPSITDF